MDRKYSDPEIWHISIDHDDAPDGSDGGYGKHGAYIPPEAMKEIVASRKLLIEKDEVIQRLREENGALGEALHEIYSKACQVMGDDDDMLLYGFARDARDIALNAYKAALLKEGGDE